MNTDFEVSFATYFFEKELPFTSYIRIKTSFRLDVMLFQFVAMGFMAEQFVTAVSIVLCNSPSVVKL